MQFKAAQASSCSVETFFRKPHSAGDGSARTGRELERGAVDLLELGGKPPLPSPLLRLRSEEREFLQPELGFLGKVSTEQLPA